jgi:predicted Zn-dependent protease
MRNLFRLTVEREKTTLIRFSLGPVLMLTLTSAFYSSFGLVSFPVQTPDGSQAESHYRDAEQSLEKKDTESALASLEKAVSLDPVNAKYLGKYADTIVAATAYARGVKFLTAQVERKPTAAIHLQIGKIEMDRYRRDPNPNEKQNAAMSAIGHLSETIKLDQKNSEARLMRGIIYHYIPVQFNQMGEAIADFEWLVKERPDMAIAYRYLADSYTKLKDVARARAVLNEAARRFPTDQKVQERLKQLPASQH